MSIEFKQTELQEESTLNPEDNAVSRNPQQEINPSSVEAAKPLSASDAESGSTLIDLSNEVDDNKALAFDINQKIDAIQLHIDNLSTGFKESKGELAKSVDELRARAERFASSIGEISQLIAQSDSSKLALIEELDSRTKEAITSISQELSGLESQADAQYTTLNYLQKNLDEAFLTVNERVSDLKGEIQLELDELKSKADEAATFRVRAEEQFGQLNLEANKNASFQNEALKKFVELDQENEQQNKTQQVFSDYLDDLQTKSNITADDLYSLRSEHAEDKQLNHKRFRYTTLGIAGIALVAASAISYLHYNESSGAAQIDTKLDKHRSAMTSLFASRDETTTSLAQLDEQVIGTNYQVAKIDQKLTELNQQIEQEKNSIKAVSSSTNESLDELLGKVSALELSLYGPKDSGVSSTNKLKIENSDWIQSQNPDHYVIQLVGVYRERSISGFVNRYASELSGAPLSSNVSNYRGQNWFNLYYGSFATFSEAQAKLDLLPEEIQRNSPWIRTMSSVQQSTIR